MLHTLYSFLLWIFSGRELECTKMMLYQLPTSPFFLVLSAYYIILKFYLFHFSLFLSLSLDVSNSFYLSFFISNFFLLLSFLTITFHSPFLHTIQSVFQIYLSFYILSLFFLLLYFFFLFIVVYFDQ